MNSNNYFSHVSICFKHFSRKGYALFSVLGKEVLIGVLSIATLSHSKAEGISIVEGAVGDSLSRQELKLDEVVVTGSRAPLTEGESAKIVTVITKEDIHRAAVASVNDVLKLSTSVDVRQRGGFGVQTDISIGGGTFDQIAILINGVNIGNPQTGHLSADFPVSLDDIERIEIIEGAAARVFGANAFNGAINIVTRSNIQASPTGILRAEGGSYGTVGANARVAVGSHSLSAGYRRSDGATENSDFRSTNAYYQGIWQTERLSVKGSAGVSGKKYGANTFYSPKYNNQYESNMRLFSAINATMRLTENMDLSVTPYWNYNEDHFQLIRGTHTGENYHRTIVGGGKANIDCSWSLGKTSVGAELRQESIRHTYNSQRTDFSLFLEHNILFRCYTLSFGVVADKNTGHDNSFHLFPGVDMAYRPTEHWKLTASYNTAFRMPTFTDLFYKSPTNEGNKDLKPEKVQSLRVAAKYILPGFTVSAGAFYDWGTDMIDWVMYSADDIYHSANFKLDNRGFNVNATKDITIADATHPMTLKIGYAYIDQVRHDDIVIYKSNYAMEYLHHKVTGSIDIPLFAEGLALNLGYRWQDRIGPAYKPFSLFDAKLSWTQKKYEASLSFNNITSYRYYDLSSVPQPGFTCLAGIAVKL